MEQAVGGQALIADRVELNNTCLFQYNAAMLSIHSVRTGTPSA